MLETLLTEWRKTPRGPTPRISAVQVYLALRLIAADAPVGRYEIASKLGLNPGVARGLLERLVVKGFITTSKRGATPTRKGRLALRLFLKARSIVHLETFDAGNLALDTATALLQLRTDRRAVSDGIVQRDAAVRSGAEGAVTMAFDGAFLRLPPENRRLADVYPVENASILSTLKLKRGDVVIICSGSDEFKAQQGALAVAAQIGNR